MVFGTHKSYNKEYFHPQGKGLEARRARKAELNLGVRCRGVGSKSRRSRNSKSARDQK